MYLVFVLRSVVSLVYKYLLVVLNLEGYQYFTF